MPRTKHILLVLCNAYAIFLTNSPDSVAKSGAQRKISPREESPEEASSTLSSQSQITKTDLYVCEEKFLYFRSLSNLQYTLYFTCEIHIYIYLMINIKWDMMSEHSHIWEKLVA